MERKKNTTQPRINFYEKSMSDDSYKDGWKKIKKEKKWRRRSREEEELKSWKINIKLKKKQQAR